MKVLKIEEIDDFKKIYTEIEDLINQKEFQSALDILVMQRETTEKYFVLLSQISIKQKKYVKARTIVENALLTYINSAALYKLLYEVLWELQDYEKAIYALADSYRLTFSEKEGNIIVEQLKDLVEKAFELLGDKKATEIIKNSQLILGEGDERAYPLDKDCKSLINRCLIDKNNQKYIVNLYKGYNAEDVSEEGRFYLKAETIRGNNHRYSRLKITEDCVIPISADLNEASIEISKDKLEHFELTKRQLQRKRINYLNFSKGEYVIKSKKDFFMGVPIIKSNKEKKKHIINLYIDGLSQVFLDKYGLGVLMPNTARFFKNGYFNQNCYTTSDWTYPSVASIYTGKTLINHKVYHPNINVKINKRGKMATNYFKEAGFLTCQINNNWRITPSSGYVEGFDRTVYQNFRGGFAIAEVIGETIEHMSAFPNNEHFIWMGIEDLHDIADGFNHDLYQQTHLTLEERVLNEMAEVSVNAKNGEDKLIKYKNQLNRIDMYLESFYHYLNENYKDDDVYVSILSDHGQGYIEETSEFLSEGRRRVPFMLKGPNVPSKVSQEIMSITDYFPNISKVTGYAYDLTETDAVILKDFGGEGREFAITETLHPKNPYRITITDDKHIFRLKTIKDTEMNGLIHFDEIEVQLIDRYSLESTIENNKNITQDYVDLVFNRIKHYLYI